ncbi:pyridoxal phosphate-dependent decarboxylase family protein [Kiloniella sp. b19]|uniref:pyridoxal phosphate-dependent decarboxylase family protein n=1 Tax=Kiloniella sp. GXU_MW_B19 TaxID=3141326 RepID=UPI0031D37BA7
MKTGFRKITRKGLQEGAPAWAEKRSQINHFFPAPDRNPAEDNLLQQAVSKAVERVNALKQEPGGPGYLGKIPSVNPQDYNAHCNNQPDYSKAKTARLAEKVSSVNEVIDQSAALFEGMPNWNSPLTMPNVIPPANIGGMVAAMMTEIFSPNIIEGEYAWNVEFSEKESAYMLGDLLGWDADKCGGLYTFGGTGCYLYGLKYALTRVLGKESRFTGIREDGKILVSRQGHYVKENTTDWTGLGMNNIIEIDTDPVTNAMSIDHLKEMLEQCRLKREPVISVICTTGTTDAFAIDPVGEVRALLDNYQNAKGYGKPFLYCDAVIGWSWIMFKGYDFAANPLGFSEEVLPHLKANHEAMMELRHADAIGCDFHKTGWAPYNCSLFLMQDEDTFVDLMRRGGSDYLQERTEYNPGLYTLETSRTGAYSMAGWATLKLFGKEGFQVMLGGVLEAQAYLRQHIREDYRSMTVVNEADNGFVSLFRVYPPLIHASFFYRKELTDPRYLDALVLGNELQERVANKLWFWFRTGHKIDGHNVPYISYSTGFRQTDYNLDAHNEKAVIYALKSFPMNLNIDREAMDMVTLAVQKACQDVLEEDQDFAGRLFAEAKKLEGELEPAE